MRIRDRLINGVIKMVSDLLFLVSMLILYALLSSYMTRTMPNIVGLLSEYVLLIIAFAVLAFLRGVLSGHVFAYPVILSEATIITALFASIPSTVVLRGVTVDIKPLIYYVWSIEMLWIIYSIITQFNDMLSDP
jgi:hypothetical protein